MWMPQSASRQSLPVRSMQAETSAPPVRVSGARVPTHVRRHRSTPMRRTKRLLRVPPRAATRRFDQYGNEWPTAVISNPPSRSSIAVHLATARAQAPTSPPRPELKLVSAGDWTLANPRPRSTCAKGLRLPRAGAADNPADDPTPPRCPGPPPCAAAPAPFGAPPFAPARAKTSWITEVRSVDPPAATSAPAHAATLLIATSRRTTMQRITTTHRASPAPWTVH